MSAGTVLADVSVFVTRRAVFSEPRSINLAPK